MDTVFFIVAKLGGLLLKVDSWLVLTVALICLSTLRGWWRTSRVLSFLFLTALLVVGFVPLGDLALRSLEAKYPAHPKIAKLDGVIVLGGSEELAVSAFWARPQVNGAADRLFAALALAEEHPDARILLAGGSGRLRDVADQSSNEASIAAELLRAVGLQGQRLIIEGQSRNTAENAQRSLALVNPQDGERWALVTSAFHMPRAMRSFKTAGWPELIAYPVDYRSRSFRDGLGWNLLHNIDRFNLAVRTYVGEWAYQIAGR